MIPLPSVEDMEELRLEARLQYYDRKIKDEADRVRRDGVQDSGRSSSCETDKGIV